MNILVIGNGFDLAHGLPTKYYDFIKFVKLLQKIDGKDDYQRNRIISDMKNYTAENSAINKSILDKMLDKSIYENQYFKELVNCIKDNGWIEYFKDKAKIQSTWVDFEMSIKELIRMFDAIKRNDEEELSLIDIQAVDIRNSMRNFVKEDRKVYSYTNPNLIDLREIISSKFIDALESDLKKVIRALEIYISLFIEEIDCNFYKGIVKNIDKIISFNYSNTYERLYEINNIEFDYIHGKANLEREINKNNMVLGIDEYLDDKIKDKYLDFIFFKKYFQRIYKKTGCNYKYWLEEIVQYNEESNIYFYGHSLSRADKDILKDLILCENVKITIFHHDDEAYRSQITNLVDVIGQDKLIEKVYGGNPTIVFISTENKKLELIGEEAEKYNDLVLSL